MSSQVTTKALVANDPKGGAPNFSLEDVTFREPGDDELLIDVIATGVCHTDLIFAGAPVDFGGPYPKVLGHEGSGRVQKVGSAVKGFEVGDPVLMSFASCATCKHCTEKHPSFCDNFSAINYGSDPSTFTLNGKSASGQFFGQSSFSSQSIVKQSSVVNVSGLVKDDEELKLFAPLGCGVQTGAGTIDVLATAGANDSVVILGLGGVGLSGIMAAKMKGCKTVIGVDRYDGRLQLAKELGATHTINTGSSDVDLAAEVQKITEGAGASITMDTTGVMKLIEAGLQFTGNRGQMIILGVPPLDAQLSVHLVAFMQTGKILRGSIEGDVTPSVYVPKMIQWYRDGKFPIDKLIKYYPVKEFGSALGEMHSGATIKPVLVWKK